MTGAEKSSLIFNGAVELFKTKADSPQEAVDMAMDILRRIDEAL